jgi:ribonuclease-3 family protein
MRLLINGTDVLTEPEAYGLPPLTLAYIGDSVYDIYVRTHFALGAKGNTGVLHALCSQVVNARAQAGFARRIEERLTEREHDIFIRGRNAKSATVPKNMSVADYRWATAIEAVAGYLYLTGRRERLAELLDMLELG